MATTAEPATELARRLAANEAARKQLQRDAADRLTRKAA